MPLSLSSTDVRVVAGLAAVAAGLGVVMAGIFARDVALITLGAGLLGAPGVASVTRPAARTSDNDKEQ